MVSQFAHDKSSRTTNNGEGSSSTGSSPSSKNSRKRTIMPKDDAKAEDAATEPSLATAELSTQVRKSLRLSSITDAELTLATGGPFISRTVSADSVKSRPHHKRAAVTEVVKKEVKKEETTIVRRGTQGRNQGYAAPATYAHLEYVADIIDYDLDVLFVGINPGVKTSQRGHHYSGPNNHFWPCLSDSGLLPPGVRLGPDDDKSLPALTNMGLTNLVDRPSRMGNELSDAECRAAAPILTAKLKKYRPRFVCFVSKQAWEMYTGVGLGLQTAWVSWDDTPEDEELLWGADLEDKRNPIQRRMNEEGYRLGPFFEGGPSAERLDEQLRKEGAPSPYFKREDGSMGIKVELKEEEVDRKEDVKMEDVEDVKPVKAELDDKTLIKKGLDDDDGDNKQYVKKEQDDKNAIKTELYHDTKPSSSSSSLAARPTPRYRGGVRGSRMFVMPSTSGRVTQYRKEDKLAYFQQLAELVRRDRQTRGVKAPWEQ
ncbi:hypothetical protein KI688_011168 [Linnemannia hyalina]|uniref:Uracil-DNA glycosylase-like domain-containing protein n=1 Tax=Linnemannia hyalina TaxID=64524 RepID=A0A9P7XZT3_9FUNG|nr:hypothetical protein KI688_011168 [Linnemannia hyalina]